MSVYPNQYSREDFLEKFLKKNNVSDSIISKFVELPEKVITDENIYELNINVNWYKIDNTFYDFELNYYCEELVEYLFNSKVFNDIEISINYLLCELMNNGYITLNEECEL
jgi:hypothetical protein